MLTRNRMSMALAALMVFSAAGGYLRAQTVPSVLNEVPDTAQVVVVISNMKSLATKVSNAATRMNIPAPQDIMGTITRNVGVKEGLDEAGSAAFVLSPAPVEGDDGAAAPPEMVMVLPTTDAKAMLAPFKPSAPENGVSEVTLPNDATQKGYVAISGKHVVFGEEREHVAHFLVKKAALGAKLSPEAVASFKANDLVVYANVPQVAKTYGKQVSDTQSMITSMIDLGAMATDSPAAAAQAGMQKEVVNLMFDAAQQFLADGTSSLLTVRLSDNGATIGGMCNFKKDSPFGKFVAAQKAAGATSLKGLTANGQPILAAGSIMWDTPSVSSLVNNIADKFLNQPALKDLKEGDQLASVKKAIEAQKQLIALTTGSSFVLVVPPDGGKTGWLRGSVLVETTDAAKYIALQNEYLKTAGVDGGLNPQLKMVITVDDSSVTVKNLKFQKIKIDFAARDAANPAPGVEEALAMVKTVYGPDGVIMYTGVVGKRVLTVIGPDLKLLDAAVDAALTQSDKLATSAEITAGQAEMIKNANIALYLPVNRWVKMAKPAEAGATDKPAPAETPMVISIGATDTSATMEVFVPMTTLSTLSEVFKSLPNPFGGGMMP